MTRHPVQGRYAAWAGRRLACLALAGLPLAGAACAQLPPAACVQPPVVRGARPDELPAATQLSTPPQAVTASEVPAAKTILPISLDTVFRLAEENNPQIGLAREKINEAYAEKRLAQLRWLPDVYAGTAFYRHEGGIQSFEGPLIRSSTGAMFSGVEINSQMDLRDYAFQKINAQRLVWQQKGELSRVTSETLLEAANSYIDLLTAMSGEAIARAIEQDLRAVLRRAELLASAEPGARVQVNRVKTALLGQQQALSKLRSQVEAASAKLTYVLGLDPCTTLVPVDQKLVPVELVDPAQPTCDLVNQALATGPGTQEMAGLLALINEGMARSNGLGSYLPVFGVRVAEGGFGAGPGDSLTWDNRFDLGLQARWNLTEYVTRRDRQRVAQAKLAQLHLAHQDLRNKLTAGVREAQVSIVSGREQLQFGEEQIRNARTTQQLSNERLKADVTPNRGDVSEVLFAVRELALAQLNYLTALSAYDKAQVRLLAASVP